VPPQERRAASRGKHALISLTGPLRTGAGTFPQIPECMESDAGAYFFVARCFANFCAMARMGLGIFIHLAASSAKSGSSHKGALIA
jgi:hypothetical protein